MSWKNTNPMEEKIRFIRAWKSEQFSVTELCQTFGISRTTGHILIKRYKEKGELAFSEESKAPKNSPNKTPQFIEDAILELRGKHKLWGARKLRVLLQKQLPDELQKTLIPSETTINAILDRNGLVKKRRKRPQRLEKLNPKFDPDVCNEIWSADYKGKFRLGNKRYCNPLTIADSKSRFLFCAKGHYKPTFKAVKQQYTRIFKEFGLPLKLHTDNGPPFGSIAAINRFSKLCYWLIDIGVTPVFSDPGRPDQNGRHERMHRDLKAYCTKPPKSTMAKQQILMDLFVEEYNFVRPHEALDMKTPNEVHSYSSRTFNPKIPPYNYDPNMKILKVSKNGATRWGHSGWLYISRAAIKRYIGLLNIGNGIWKVYYRDVFLAYFDEKLKQHNLQTIKLTRAIV